MKHQPELVQGVQVLKVLRAQLVEVCAYSLELIVNSSDLVVFEFQVVKGVAESALKFSFDTFQRIQLIFIVLSESKVLTALVFQPSS